jgi:hypothetical protein
LIRRRTDRRSRGQIALRDLFRIDAEWLRPAA